MRVRPSPSGKNLDLLTFAATAAALPTTLYVDTATLVETQDQYGSAVAPYKTLTQAIAHANASATAAWQFVIAFGNYSAEAALECLPNKRYIFKGVLRIPGIMRLPPILWTVTGNRTSQIVFQAVTVGLITVLDGIVPAINAICIFEGCECNGIDAAAALSDITLAILGTSLASFQTTTTPIVQMVARTNPILLRSGSIFAQNCQFESTCTKIEASQLLTDGCSFAQDIEISGVSSELRASKWPVGPFDFEFSGSPGTLSVDTDTRHYFDIQNVTLINATILATDQTYDTSSVIPIPEGSTTGQTTLATAVTFTGASYRIIGFASANHLYIVATAVSAPTTLVIAVYQSPSGQTTPPLPLVGTASLLITAPGTFLVPLSATMRLNPGVAFFLIGKVAAGGNITIRSYTTPTQELLNDTSVPAAVYPTAFTTTIGVTTSPPATLNPTPAGGLVTPAGASNVTAILRLATV